MGDVKKYATYLETVGKTPLVVLHKVLPEAARHATVVCKLEMQNPGGSIKDRIAVKSSQSDAFYFCEFKIFAHYDTTGPEIWEQTDGEIDMFVHGIGTGGCIAGVGKYLKEKKPSVQIIALEPSNARVHVGEPMNPHTIVGLAPGMPSEFLEGPFDTEAARGVVDEWAHCSADDAVAWARAATTKEGMMIGPSAGAALKVAVEVASRPESKGKTVCVVFASHGIRYTAHPLWKEMKAEAVGALPVPPNMDKSLPPLQWASDAQESNSAS